MGFLVNKEQSEHRVELSEREAEVLNLTARGLTNKEIGSRLHISNRTRPGPPAQNIQQAGCQQPDGSSDQSIDTWLARPRT